VRPAGPAPTTMVRSPATSLATVRGMALPVLFTDALRNAAPHRSGALGPHPPWDLAHTKPMAPKFHWAAKNHNPAAISEGSVEFSPSTPYWADALAVKHRQE